MYIYNTYIMQHAGESGGLWFSLNFGFLFVIRTFSMSLSPQPTPLEADSILTATRKAFQNENAHAMEHNSVTNFCFLLKSQTKMIFDEIYYIFNRPFYRDWISGFECQMCNNPINSHIFQIRIFYTQIGTDWKIRFLCIQSYRNMVKYTI